jgi:hypothetical protein
VFFPRKLSQTIIRVMAHSSRVKDMLDALTPDERADLAEALARSPKLLPADAFLALLASLPRDSGLADDIEAGVRASRATSEAPTSPWDR